MKKIICSVLVLISVLLLVSCAEADAIKNGIKDKLPKPEQYEIVEAIMKKPEITEEFKHPYSLLVVQEVNGKNIIAVVDGTEARYSIPTWFGDATIKPGTYILVEHADNSLPTYPMQFGYIYQMFHYGVDGVVLEGVKPN